MKKLNERHCIDVVPFLMKDTIIICSINGGFEGLYYKE